MKPESKKTHRNTDKSHCNSEETALCFDLSQLSEALKVAELNKIHHNDKQNEIGSCYDLSKLSEATEAIVNTSNSNSNVATDATTATQNEIDSLFDFAELEEALDAAEEKSKKSLAFRARQVVRKRQQKHLRMYLSTLDLIEWDISDDEKLEQTMQQERNFPIRYRLGRIVEIGAARGRVLRSKLL